MQTTWALAFFEFLTTKLFIDRPLISGYPYASCKLVYAIKQPLVAFEHHSFIYLPAQVTHFGLLHQQPAKANDKLLSASQYRYDSWPRHNIFHWSLYLDLLNSESPSREPHQIFDIPSPETENPNEFISPSTTVLVNFSSAVHWMRLQNAQIVPNTFRASSGKMSRILYQTFNWL